MGVIWFRLKFRSLRQALSKATGVHFFRGRVKLNAVNPGKVHEEEKVIEVLEEEKVIDMKNADGMKICCDCDCRYRCEQCITGFGECIPGMIVGSCLLVAVYVFAPLVLLGLVVLCCTVSCGWYCEDSDIGLGWLILINFACSLPLFCWIWWGFVCA